MLLVIFLINKVCEEVEVVRYAVGSVRWRVSAVSSDHPLFRFVETGDLPIHKLCACLFLCVCVCVSARTCFCVCVRTGRGSN